ncbi:MAG: ribbon-helix-helix domain-containing protein [Actinobacteria bacterium]|nr:ribbon-helix-helix domain-containing protein [Actinomycetota bacterium]MCG2807242.1 ribbon-helix-helix domain-containing protein [Coriobacteriia bacterium]
MAKVNVSLPDDLLEQVDSLAEELDRSRSGLVQEATAHYVVHLQEKIAAEERRESILQAMAGMREIAKHLPPGMDGTEIIRRDRDNDYKPWSIDE